MPSRSKSKNKKKLRQQSFREAHQEAIVHDNFEAIPSRRKAPPPLTAKTEAQGLYISTILHSDITFGIGPAGTGKTYVAATLACELLDAGEIDQIVLTRPALDVEGFGALPGEMEDKYAPYIEPFMDVFNKRYSKGQLEYMLKSQRIVAKPLSFMRGKTFDRAWILLDEAQNTTVGQMKMALTRIGQGSKILVSGDMSQNDLPKHMASGLDYAVTRLETLPEIGITRFEREDVVRNGIIAKILQRFED